MRTPIKTATMAFPKCQSNQRSLPFFPLQVFYRVSTFFLTGALMPSNLTNCLRATFQNQDKLLFFSKVFSPTKKPSSFPKVCLGFGKLSQDSRSTHTKRKFWQIGPRNLGQLLSPNSRVFSNVRVNMQFCNHFVIRWFQYLTWQWKTCRISPKQYKRHIKKLGSGLAGLAVHADLGNFSSVFAIQISMFLCKMSYLGSKLSGICDLVYKYTNWGSGKDSLGIRTAMQNVSQIFVTCPQNNWRKLRKGSRCSSEASKIVILMLIKNLPKNLHQRPHL